MIKNNKKGISLIVLIVTIAVIIILATAVILSVANDRPIDSAQEAVDLHNSSVLIENATALSTQWTLEKRLGKTTFSRNDYVKQGLHDQGFTKDEIEDLVVSEVTGKVGRKGGAIDIASNPQKYYGAYVDYKENSGSGVSWKIFYSDESNIYLIADDYIPYSSIPNSTKDGQVTQHKPNKGDNDYRAYFTNILEDYMGSASITDNRLQDLNREYFSYLKSSNQQSTNPDMKSVAYILDTYAWKEFATGVGAEYAIGAPTVEMFMKSYKQKYPDFNLEYKVAGIEKYKPIGGYTYVENNGSFYVSSSYAFNKIDDSLYVIRGTSKAYAMWLASPSAPDTNTLGAVANDGNLGHDGGGHICYYYTSNFGLRPIICLKSSVKLEEQGLGEYTIK